MTVEKLIPHKFHPRGATFDPTVRDDRIKLHIIQIDVGGGFQLHASDEAYRLELRVNGQASIVAASIRGVRLALNTLLQLFYATSGNEELYTPHAPVLISDWPRFEHRGLNLDIARNEITPKAVIRTLDAMSLCKLNRLHLHATDSQSWPLDIPTLPELSRYGAYRDQQMWTTLNLRQVQEYGSSLGIDVYLEIDMPGHTSSIFHSHPELIATYDHDLVNYSASEPPSGQLKLNSTAVHSFIDTLLGDVLPRISPYSSLFHIGGDELNTNVYELDDTVKSSSRSILRPLLESFYAKILNHTNSHSLDPLFWEETLLDWDIDLPKNSVIQVWRSQEALAAVVNKGYRALAGSASHWYLDCGFGIFLDPDPFDPETVIKPPYLDWCNPYKNWRQIYSYNPLAGISEEKEHLVIGGEVHLWAELTDSITLDGKLWPRAAAAAEILWSGARQVDESVTRRLAEFRERLVLKGIQASVVQMEWCLKNPGQCKH